MHLQMDEHMILACEGETAEAYESKQLFFFFFFNWPSDAKTAPEKPTS